MSQDNHSKDYLVSIMFSHYDRNNNGNLEATELNEVTFFIPYCRFVLNARNRLWSGVFNDYIGIILMKILRVVVLTILSVGLRTEIE